MTYIAPVVVHIEDYGKIFETSTQGGTYPSGYEFALFYQGGGQWTNGPPHDPVYVDAVWAWGVNMDGVGNPKDKSKQYAAWHMESKFYQGPNQQSPLTEVFLHTIDISGAVRRPISWTGTYDGSYSDLGLAASVVVLQDEDHAPRLTFDFQAANACSVHKGFSFTFLENNTPVARQFNAAGTSAYALPYFDDADMMVATRPITTQATASTASGPVLSSRGANTSGARVQAPDAGACMVEVSCGKDGTKKTSVLGVDSAGNFVVSQVGPTGCMYHDYNDTAIWRDRLNGYTKRMELSKIRLNVAAPIRPLVCTVATLPNPQTAGLGAEIVVADHPTGIVKAMSDGAKWCVVATIDNTKVV